MPFTDFLKIENRFDDSIAMKTKVDEFRKTLRSHDVSLLENKNVHLEIEELSNAPDGRFDILYKGVKFECLFKRHTTSRNMYVIFSGARKPAQNEPTFKRWSYYKYFDGSMLNIDDPMCKLHSNLGLGWYYGTESESYCDYIVDIINEFARQNDFENIFFVASSGGGYAALYCACKIEHSTVIAINPQINLAIYEGAKNFQSITGLDLSSNDKFERNHLPQLIKDAKKSRFIIVENCASDTDMAQLNNLCKILNTNYRYGLNLLDDNVLAWVYEGDTSVPHNAQEYYPMLFALIFLSKHFDNAMDFGELYLIFSEFWNDHYLLTNENQKLISKSTRKIKCLSSSSSYITSEFDGISDNYIYIYIYIYI